MLSIAIALKTLAGISNYVMQKITVTQYLPVRHIYLKFVLSLFFFSILVLLGFIKFEVSLTFNSVFIILSVNILGYLSMFLFNSNLSKYPAHIVYPFIHSKIIIILLIDSYLGILNLSPGLILSCIAALMGLYLLSSSNKKGKVIDSCFVVKILSCIILAILSGYVVRFGLENNYYNVGGYILSQYIIISLISFYFVPVKKISRKEFLIYTPQVISNILYGITNIYIYTHSVFLNSLTGISSLIIVSYITSKIMKQPISAKNYLGLLTAVGAFIYISYELINH